MTYNLHIMLRTEIEMGARRHNTVDELPAAWNAKWRNTWGWPADDAQGVLQDTLGDHYFGSFPPTLGNIMSGQLMAAAPAGERSGRRQPAACAAAQLADR